MFLLAAIPVVLCIIALPWMIAESLQSKRAKRQVVKNYHKCRVCGDRTNDWHYGKRGFVCAACELDTSETLEDQFNRLMDSRHAEHDEACSPWADDESLFHEED